MDFDISVEMAVRSQRCGRARSAVGGTASRGPEVPWRAALVVGCTFVVRGRLLVAGSGLGAGLDRSDGASLGAASVWALCQRTIHRLAGREFSVDVRRNRRNLRTEL